MSNNKPTIYEAMCKLNESLEEMKLPPNDQFQLCILYAINLLDHTPYEKINELADFIRDKILYYYSEKQFNMNKKIHMMNNETNTTQNTIQ